MNKDHGNDLKADDGERFRLPEDRNNFQDDETG